MATYEELYNQKCLEYSALKEELEDYQQTEMESQIKQLERQLAETKNKCIVLNDELEKQKERLNSQTKQMQKNIENLKAENEQIQQNLSIKIKKIVELENELDQANSLRREQEALVEDLESKVDGTLEQLAIVQTELENSRNQSQEQIERLRQQLRENQDELFVTKQKTQLEIERLTKSVIQSPTSGHFRYDSRERNSRSNNELDSPGEIRTIPAEPNGLFKMDMELSNEHEMTRSLKSTSPQGRVDNHFQNCSQNIQQLKVNTVGFSKSLNLISALIKDLDEKMCKIRNQKAQ